MPALGIDISGTTDIDPMLTFSDGPKAVAESVIVSLLHDPGRLWWAPQRGHNVNQYLHQPSEIDEIERAIQSQCEADERVVSAVATVTFQAKTLTLDCKLTLTNNAGDVEFTLSVDEAGKVLSASIN
jgi:hypothetical protein